MTELVVLVCSIVNGAICKDVSLIFADLPIMTCIVGAQPELARWSETHPNWSVRKWSCRAAGQFANL